MLPSDGTSVSCLFGGHPNPLIEDQRDPYPFRLPEGYEDLAFSSNIGLGWEGGSGRAVNPGSMALETVFLPLVSESLMASKRGLKTF